MADFARTARLAGSETIGGREAFILRADDVNQTQRTADGQTFTIRTATFWVDTAEYVPLKFRMEGVATSQGEQRDWSSKSRIRITGRSARCTCLTGR